MLLDPSGLLCLQHEAEPFHREANDAYGLARTRLTHNYVFAEYVALAQARRFPRAAALVYITDLIDSPEIAIVWVDEPLHREALALLVARADKSYSLCDAVSFVLMRQPKIHEALTTDGHFDQEGFRRLLR